MIRYLSLAVMTVFAVIPLLGQDDFNPSSPSEPGAPPTKLVLLAEPADGGTLYGGGKYVSETNISISAYAKTNFKFAAWTDTKGNIISINSSYIICKGTDNDTLVAHFDFNPGSPAEPVPGSNLVYYRLDVEAGYGGSASGGGRYQCGKQVRINATCNANFEFAGWTNDEGTLVSMEKNYSYTTNAFPETLTANFKFNPNSPTEPSDPILRHNITVDCTEGGTAESNATVVLSGNKAYLTANPNPGYLFIGWYLNGVLYTKDLSFTYVMGNEDVSFEARFEFNPEAPSEPSQPSDKQYALYLMSEITFPGTQIDCPLYLTSLAPLHDMTFRLTFPEEAQPDWNTLQLDDKAQGYAVEVNETDSANVWQLTMTGGTVTAGNTKLLNIKLNVPETTACGTSYQVKINQVSVTEENGNTVTASTRNGRVYVYKLGDNNGDGEINVTDKMNTVLHVVGMTTKDFIREVADVNEDGTLDVSDAMGVISILLDE
ncbi:InlB B-repeat-containing protein [Xylanibacter muris]|nr:InlB B-repeat-containing protein [Xylanibacter muris]